MAETKLTEKQLEALHLIAAGKVTEHRFGYAAWRIWGANPTVVGRIISMGLATWGEISGDDKPLFLTDLGRSALNGEQG